MKNRDYLNKLLLLCTEKQTDLFGRMYPDGVSKAQLSWAVTQLENTLKGLNDQNEQMKALKAGHKDAISETESEKYKLTHKIERLENELNEVANRLGRVQNPINIENSEVQERLELLSALEAGGVDNWEWYDESISNYRNQ